ncbi:hypothetical protein AEAC466_17185 [Asticcacaulis sp. AC466]|uniref:hypothetical protein n=1 Tax=Asticcacaulis sp. AC466 TaxID=1282362 RepID=UPI0003C3ACFE|nr:hypothetical protein [Asticcacaulis sp. AC466]ESQ82358.1 hypothetical protein AEAC466_17185 [Asticcacaulis sp. AC466]
MKRHLFLWMLVFLAFLLPAIYLTSKISYIRADHPVEDHKNSLGADSVALEDVDPIGVSILDADVDENVFVHGLLQDFKETYPDISTSENNPLFQPIVSNIVASLLEISKSQEVGYHYGGSPGSIFDPKHSIPNEEALNDKFDAKLNIVDQKGKDTFLIVFLGYRSTKKIFVFPSAKGCVQVGYSPMRSDDKYVNRQRFTLDFPENLDNFEGIPTRDITVNNVSMNYIEMERSYENYMLICAFKGKPAKDNFSEYSKTITFLDEKLLEGKFKGFSPVYNIHVTPSLSSAKDLTYNHNTTSVSIGGAKLFDADSIAQPGESVSFSWTDDWLKQLRDIYLIIIGGLVSLALTALAEGFRPLIVKWTQVA